MDERLYEKLNEINDLNDRILLKKIINGVFKSLEEYSDNSFNQLEKRVFNELKYEKEKYNIYSTIIKRNKIDPTDNFLYPILPEDIEEKIYDTKEIIRFIEEKKPKNMFKIFLKCDYLVFKEFINSNLKIKGKIETNKKVYQAYFKVNQNKEYLNKVNNLYQSFINTNIPWTSINNPYIHKIANVVLLGCEDKFENDEEIIKIEVDFGEYSKYIKYDIVPLWNIKQIKMKCNGFPTPCIDKINYEHNISFFIEGEKNGFLVDSENEDINYVMSTNESLIISSKIGVSKPWKLYEFIKYDAKKAVKYQYELISNEININFSNKLSFNKPCRIRTKTELARFINSFKASKYLKFNDLKLEQNNEEEFKESYEVNDFIIDEIRDENIKKNLILYFEPVDKENYLNKDILSFLVSEVQLIYPEYRCEGRLE